MTRIRIERLDPLFFSPLVTLRLPECEHLNRQLIAEIAALRTGVDGLERSNRNGWHSVSDVFDRAETGFVQLRGEILEAVRLATLRIAPGFDFSDKQLQVEGWINVNGRGAYNTPHDHPGFAWSGCYYVEVPSPPARTSGAIEFLDPRINVRVITIESAPCFFSKFTVQPEAGILLLFPSYLRHWVYPNEAAAERVSIAFNARFAPRL